MQYCATSIWPNSPKYWQKSDPNYVFKYAKKFSKTGTEVGPLQDPHGDRVNGKKLMRDLLLNQFSSVFITPSANHVISDVTSLFYAMHHSMYV